MSVSDILSTRQGSKYSEGDVRRVVSNCSKSRFTLQEDPQTGILQIRANQGHTMQVHSQNVYMCTHAGSCWYNHKNGNLSLVMTSG